MPPSPSLISGAFGVYLRDLRGSASRRDLGETLRNQCPVQMLVSGSAIQGWEAGNIPPWPALVAYSRHFKLPLIDLVARLAATLQTRDGRDLGRHTVTHSADARLAVHALELDNARLRAELDRVVGIAGDLLAVSVAARKGGGAAAGGARRVGGARKP